jgi:hypothetical protein
VFAPTYKQFDADEFLIKPGRAKRYLLRLEFLRWWVLVRALKYDVIHFNFGQNILPSPTASGHGQHGTFLRKLYNLYSTPFSWWMFDLPLLKRLGKTICVTFQGGDSRQGDVQLARYKWSDADEERPGYYHPSVDRLKRIRIRQWDKYADHIYYLNPDLGWVLPERAKFLPYVCCDPKEMEFVQRPRWGPRRLALGHIVGHTRPKGTRYVLKDVHKLRNHPYKFDWQFKFKIPSPEVMRTLASIDVLLEQFVIGWYGGLAVEAMSIGVVPVFFVRKHDCRFVPVEMLSDLRRASLQTTKEELADRIRNILNGVYPLDWYSQNARNYVLKWHDPHKIAAQLVEDYKTKRR